MPHNAEVWPQTFSAAGASSAALEHLRDPAFLKLIEFFEAKGVPALKQEDRREQWYEDWISYQSQHRLYASMLSPKQFSSRGELDLLRLVRFLEVFGYFSPSHGYSLQVTFLGLFPILMGSNETLKREAIATLENGGLFALGVSEKDHGADLLGNEFAVARTGDGAFVANGSKYYIGNANCASMITILAREHEPNSARNGRRARFVLYAQRPQGLRNVRKIRTLGVRAAFVGEFDVKDYQFSQSDVIAEGRDAWDAVIGTVTLGKFFLGFGSIGICEHAFAEASAHLGSRILYAKSAIEMPHIRLAMAQAYARLTAMKLYAYRALDYVHAASADDRRYLLFTAVQKAKVSTEGVKVMALISECVGAKGFESETYIEMALRDAQLIPSLEGSAHINLAMAAQFIPKYFNQADSEVISPKSLIGGNAAARENTYLMQARARNTGDIAFANFLRAYEPLSQIETVQIFARQAQRFARIASRARSDGAAVEDQSHALAMGQCLATICYGELIAENAALLEMPPQMISIIFHLLVRDLGAAAMALASLPGIDPALRAMLRRLDAVPKTTPADWDFVFARVAAAGDKRAPQ